VAFQRWLPGQHTQERALPRAIQPQHQHLALLQLFQRRLLLLLLVLGLWGRGQAVLANLPPDPFQGPLKAPQRTSALHPSRDVVCRNGKNAAFGVLDCKPALSAFPGMISGTFLLLRSPDFRRV
jgi:hypothetical protein